MSYVPHLPSAMRGDPESSHAIGEWTELFYDLIFVAAALIFSAAAEHVHPERAIAWIVLVFSATWWIWMTTTACANRFQMNDLLHRITLLVQMLLIVLIAMESRVSVGKDSRYLVVEYGLLLLSVSFLYFRGSRRDTPDSSAARTMAAINAIAAVAFLLSAFGGEGVRLVVGAIGLVIAVAPSVVLWIRLPRFTSESEEHFVERMGAFTLILCGESFIEVAITVSKSSISRLDLVSLIFEFVLTFTIFTVYFTDAPRAGLRQSRVGWWVLGHLLAMIGIAGTAIGASQLVDISGSHHIRDSEILKLGGSLALFFLALAMIGVCGRRFPARPLLAWRLGTAPAIIIVSAIAWWIPTLHLAEALPILTAIVILHAVGASQLRRKTSISQPDVINSRPAQSTPLP